MRACIVRDLTKTKPQTLTPDLFDTWQNDDRWLGFGYIGARRNYLLGDDTDPEIPTPDPQLVADADTAILARARELGWTADDLFEWANSKLGRWFGDYAFGGYGTTGQDLRHGRALIRDPR